MEEVEEGKARFRAHIEAVPTEDMDVFYNPRMRENRDLSLMLMRELLEEREGPVRFAFPLAASGVRALRLACEHTDALIDRRCEFHLNDRNEAAILLARENLKQIPEDLREHLTMSFSVQDANVFLRESRGFDYIDIDPFGSPVPFLDSALTRIRNRGILAVTATDTAALTGTYPKTSLRRYAARSARTPLMHLEASRMLIAYCQRIAASHDIELAILLAYAREHYIKLFFRARRQRTRASSLIAQHAYVLVCTRCGYNAKRLADADIERSASDQNTPECPFCNRTLTLIGKLSVPFGDPDMIRKILERFEQGSYAPHLRVQLERLVEETDLDQDAYHVDTHRIASGEVPRIHAIIEAIRAEGFACVRSLFNLTAIRTTCPPALLKTHIQRLGGVP